MSTKSGWRDVRVWRANFLSKERTTGHAHRRAPGLAVTAGVGSDTRRWVITHTLSGSKLPPAWRSKDDAQAALLALGEIANWRKPARDLAAESGLFDAIHAIAYATDAVFEYGLAGAA